MSDFEATGKDAAPASPETVNASDSQETRINETPPQSYPQQPYAPQPQSSAHQPYAPQSRQSQPSGKPNRVSLVLAICFTALMVLQVLLSISGVVFIGGWVTGILSIGAGVLLILGICQRSKAGNTLFGVGLFAIAAGSILSILASPYNYILVNSYNYDSDSMIAALAMLALEVIVPTSLTISGISYFVSNDSFASTRVIMIIIMIAEIIIRTLYGVFGLLGLLNMLTYTALGFCVLLFKPAK